MIDTLYYGEHCSCSGHSHFHNESPAISFNVVQAFLQRIHNKPELAEGIDPGLWSAVVKVINEATVEGLTQSNATSTHDEEFYRALRHSNEVFAAFKVHSLAGKVIKNLLDSDGKLKPFSQWVDDVKGITSHHVGAWLRTEYDTAVIRAHNAADWREFERNKDILPNLRWMPTTSPSPEGSHRNYWTAKLTLPIDDPFWNNHHPGDRWNCKCSLEATDDPVNRPADMDAPLPQKGLENNPGKDGHIFNDTHPYFPKDCNSCPFNKGLKNKLVTFFRNEKKHCYDCTKIDFVIPTTKEDIKKLTIEQKHAIYSLPINQQFEEVEKNVFKHRLKAKDAEDYNRLLEVANVYAATGEKVWILPEIHKIEVEIRQILGLKSETKTPDIKLANNGQLIDVKSPETYGNIIHNANKASAQGGIACITDHAERLTLNLKQLEKLSMNILKQEFYNKSEVHFYIEGTLYKYNSQGKILD